MESQQRVIKSYEWSVTGGLQGTESEMTSLEKTWSEMTIPEIGRQDAVLQFVCWGDIAVVFKQAQKDGNQRFEAWLGWTR